MLARYIYMLVAVAALAALAGQAVAQQAPYAGMEKRTIKAMSSARVADIKAGKGAGYALTAELNGYPGPRHVLDLAGELKLGPLQIKKTQLLFDTMQGEAKALGGEMIAREARLEALFAGGGIDEPALQTTVAAIAEIEGRLRATHLKYHLTMKSLLSPAQVASYNRLRGYGGSGGMMHGGSGGGHGK